MAKEDQPLRNAGKSIAKGAENTTDALSEGRLMDAAESAWESTATAARETAKSVAKAVTGSPRQDNRP